MWNCGTKKKERIETFVNGNFDYFIESRALIDFHYIATEINHTKKEISDLSLNNTKNLNVKKIGKYWLAPNK